MCLVFFAMPQDINAYNDDVPSEELPFPIIADSNRELAVKLGMLDPDEKDKDGMPLTARVVNIQCYFCVAFLHTITLFPLIIGSFNPSHSPLSLTFF